MIAYIARRIAAMIGLLVLLAAIVFGLQELAPGDPVRASIGANASQQAVAQARQEMGLNDPLPVRFGRYLGDLAQGNFGESYRTHRPVLTDLLTFGPPTIELVFAALIVAVVISGIFGLSMLLNWRGARFIRGFVLGTGAAPPFLLAIAAVLVFHVWLGWFPIDGQGPDVQTVTGMPVVDAILTGDFGDLGSLLAHLALPAIVLSLAPALAIGRVFAGSLKATSGMEHIRTAESKGLDDRDIVAHHVVRNSLAPALSMTALQVGVMFAGVIAVEQIFSWPGIGNYLAASIPVSDFPAIAAVTLVLGAIYMSANVIVDIAQVLADPRTGT